VSGLDNESADAVLHPHDGLLVLRQLQEPCVIQALDIAAVELFQWQENGLI
jgi:hypothetical protein